MSNQSQPDGNLGMRLGVLLIGIGALLAGIRIMNGSNATRKTLPASAKYNGTPVECLQELVAKYRKTKAYSDHGKLTLSFTRGGRKSEQTWDSSVQFVRPGRLRLQAYQLLVVSDVASEQKRFFARLEDPETNNIDNQVVSRAAPGTISLTDFVGDRILADQLGSRLQRPPVQLELLLGEKALASLFTPDFKLAFLDPAETHGVMCQRIEAASTDGKLVFWVDADKLLLHKLEYPSSALLPELAQDPFVTDGRLVAEFADATFEPKLTELDFSYTPPPAAHLVKSFVPPPTTSRTEILGKPVGDFEFVSPDGQKLTRDSIAGKITVLFWYAHHPLCEKTAQAFADLANKYRDNPDIRFLAVCTEAADVGDKQILDQLKSWRVSFNTVRDLKEHRSQVFSVRDLPSVVLLDAAGTYQSLLVGSEGVNALPSALARLQRGDDLAAEAKAHVRKIREEYVKLLESGGLPSGANEAASIASASQPDAFELAPAWKQDGLSNVHGLVSVLGEEPRVFAIVKDREIWEINASGEVKKKHSPDLPKDATLGSLRTITHNGKTYFAAFQTLSSGVVLFDDQFKVLASYPAESEEKAPVIDVQFAPFAANAEPLVLVAFAENVGLHAVALDGKREWKNRSYLPLGGLTISHADPERGRSALLTGRGTLGVVNKFGNEDPELKVPGWSLVQMHTNRMDTKQAGYAAVVRNPNDEPFMIGLNREFEEQWNYPLANIGFSKPIDFVTNGKLRKYSTGEWVFAWADGSVHFVAEDGSFSDNFNSGLSIQGIALLNQGDEALLVLSTNDSVQAWKVTEKKNFEPKLPELK